MPPDKFHFHFEDVFTETDSYDGPRKGIANFRGAPHFYECVFSDERQDYTNRYMLTPIRDDVFRLALEDWAIWTRWQKAFQAGLTTRETHPALPEDLDRHREIESILVDQLKTDTQLSIVRHAKFLVVLPEDAEGLSTNVMVEWVEPSDAMDDSIWADSRSAQ